MPMNEYVQVGDEGQNTSEQSLEAVKDLVESGVDAGEETTESRDGGSAAEEVVERSGDVLFRNVREQLIP
jgi:hypothetical protein